MKDNFSISNRELMLTYTNLILAKILFVFPGIMVKSSGNAAWIQMIISLIFAVVLFFITDRCCKSGIDIFDSAEKALGKVYRVIIGSVITIVLIINLAVNIRIYCEAINTVLLPGTPIKLILLLFILAISAGAYMGILSITRIHSLFLPIAAFVMLFFLVILLPTVNLNNIFPIFGTSNLIKTGFESLTVFADVLTIYIILPYCNNKGDIKKAMYSSIFTAGAISLVIILLYCLIYPYPISGEFIIPVYQMARIATVGSYFQRFEAFFEFVWSIVMMLYSSFYLFIISLSFSKSFNVKYYKELILPIALLASGVGFIPTNFVTFIDDSNMVMKIIAPALFMAVIITGISYKIKAKRDI